jgi:hypothetical protein
VHVATGMAYARYLRALRVRPPADRSARCEAEKCAVRSHLDLRGPIVR